MDGRTADHRHRLRERYRDGLGESHSGQSWNAVIDLLVAHRTVRDYADRPLPGDLLETIAASAQSAPTSSNLQFWSMVAVTDKERQLRLSAVGSNQRHIARAPLFLAFIADLSRLDAMAAEAGRTAEGLDYLECFVVAVADAAFAAQNTVVALEALGLGCCYIGGMRNDPEAVARELGLPPRAFCVFGMTVGYPDPEKPADVKPRLPQSAILFREQYGRTPAGDVAAYDARMREFRREQGLPDEPWSEMSLARVATASTLRGREKLREILDRMGFPLR